MSDVAIRVERLGKQYRIGKRERYRTLRDTLTDSLSAPFRGLASAFRVPAADEARASGDLIWALRDVSFDVPQGAVLGIIGRNGAGKSTLLKVLSRITEPTEGRVELHGRVGSLLEVGTGFHPELTGRENIFLNGAILGMRKSEIARKFDEIVAFAEVAKFIDTPVKHYSSGMYMRLAFAVAAHLEPEILIVDEVLAVGDAQFQKKCLGKMGEVAKQGRTVIFVSHNFVAVQNLCSRALLLKDGQLAATGRTHAVLNEYMAESERPETDLALRSDRSGSGEVRFVNCAILSRSGEDRPVVRCGEDVTIRLHFRCSTRIERPAFSLTVRSSAGVPIFAAYTTDTGAVVGPLDRDGFIDLDVTRPNLMPGRYLLDLAVGDELNPHRYDLLHEAAELHVEATDVYGSGRLNGANFSLVYFECQWRLGCPVFA
jgi:lipopolysaccharide transport system ATP-binding protein